jgi:hypothetical protein
MSAIFDTLIIETYSQLMAVCVGTAIFATVLRLIFVRAKRLRGARASNGIYSANVTKREQLQSKFDRPRSDARRPANGMDFDKLATVISEANDRACHISETQSAAAIKLDAAEMAVIRMIAEIDGVMTIPGKPKRPAPIVAGPHLMAARPPAACVLPLPIHTGLAA